MDTVRATRARQDTENWLLTGRDYGEQRFSPLSAINDKTVPRLGLAWTFKVDVDRGMESTPIVVDGVLYVTGPFSMVYALNAATGELLWRYDPEVDRSKMNQACCDAVNRGVAAWRGKIFVGTIDGRLVALDARTGAVVWTADTVADHARSYSITGAPRIVKDKVVIGNGGAEYGVRGYVTAYDTETGKQAWRFFTVPGRPELPAEDRAMEIAKPTWFGTRYAEIGGGGTVWDSMSYDPQLNLLYLGVGNGGPHSQLIRSEGKGDNLFLSSIVAINPDTGQYVWHYQTTPGDQWDYTASQQMILADIKIEGRLRKVIMQAPKNGFFYVIDRRTGEFISANNFVPVNWAKGIDKKTGRPIIDREAAGYEDGRTRVITPGPAGAHNWQPMSFNPRTGLVYLPAAINAWSFEQLADVPPVRQGLMILGIRGLPAITPTGKESVESLMPDLTRPQDLRRLSDSWSGRLIAWDPVRQKEVWTQEYRDMYGGGTLSTAGNLVFQGTPDGRFVAYRATDGKSLWESDVNSTGISAGPISYAVAGQQYVAVAAGGTASLAYGGLVSHTPRMKPDARIVVYKLDGKAPMPPKLLPESLKLTAIPIQIDPEVAKEGRITYTANCRSCHGMEAVSSGIVPDLRYIDSETVQNFHAILKGAYAQAGMPDFSDKLSDAQMTSILHYLAKRNMDLRQARQLEDR